MYDTSDIRKGLKVLMDGNPYTVIEFQFVKPGKGAAFTRTKFKNLLTGAVVERNIRSGEKLEPANVETRDMQYLYKEGGDLVFMDQTNYEQVTISADLIGDAHDLMKDNLPCTVVFTPTPTLVNSGKFCRRFGPESASNPSFGVTPFPPRSIPSPGEPWIELPRIALPSQHVI